MKFKLGIGVCLLCAMLLEISGCSHEQVSQSAKGKTPSTAQSPGKDNGSSLSNNKTHDLNSDQISDNPQSNKSGQSQASGANKVR